MGRPKGATLQRGVSIPNCVAVSIYNCARQQSLRELIATNPTEEFRGIYLENGLNPTRKNVLVPGSIGVYTGGGNYNPAQVMRDSAVIAHTSKLDKLLAQVADKTHVEMPIAEIRALIEHTVADDSESEHVWDPVAIAESIRQYAELRGENVGYVYVDRDRDLQGQRRETQGILSGGEVRTVPDDHLTFASLNRSAASVRSTMCCCA
jgi:hypothetical protein